MDMDKTFKSLKEDSEFAEGKKFERQLITSKSTEYMKGFSFWPVPDARKGNNLYDVRSYDLKPGIDLYGTHLATYYSKVEPNIPQFIKCVDPL